MAMDNVVLLVFTSLKAGRIVDIVYTHVFTRARDDKSGYTSTFAVLSYYCASFKANMEILLLPR